ncbi:DUF1254 domain-containing protein [Actinomycetospora chlora]|uniref:DUF1254 domain-containing protein n=1 Tax=Actinomycetospora chlora TaxID=663608 RepID=A0ABP9B3I3_9PSEU
MGVPTDDLAGTGVGRSGRDDLVPHDAAGRAAWCGALGLQAVVWGTPAVLQYAQMSEQVLAPGAPGRLATFAHERTPAGPDFAGFRAPNVDTLYSNAWLDLRAGPAELHLPAFGDRYATVQVVDAHSNAGNISRRTVGDDRRFWLVPARWRGEAPAGVTVVPVGTDIVWLLLRIQVLGDDLAAVHRLQDAVTLTGARSLDDPVPIVGADEVEEDWRAFYRGLDAVLRLNGVPADEWAHVRQFRALGLLGPEPWDEAALDEVTAGALQDSFARAQSLLRAGRPLLGTPTGTGWTRVRDKGAHGHNVLARAVMNHVGLGANVAEENTSFNTHVDADGVGLAGARAPYRLVLPTPPPARAFWSVTLYHVETGRLYADPQGRHSLGGAAADPGDDSGPVEMVIAHEDTGATSWLPCPQGAFYLILRIYSPGAAVVDGSWVPPGVAAAAPPVPAS